MEAPTRAESQGRLVASKRRLSGAQSVVALGSQRFSALHAEGRTQSDRRTEAEEATWQSLDSFLSPSSPEAVPNADTVQPATFQKCRGGWWPAAQMEGQCCSGPSRAPRKFLRRSPDPGAWNVAAVGGGLCRADFVQTRLSGRARVPSGWCPYGKEEEERTQTHGGTTMQGHRGGVRQSQGLGLAASGLRRDISFA